MICQSLLKGEVVRKDSIGFLHIGYQNQQTAKLQYNCNDVGTVLLDCPKVWKHLVNTWLYSKVRTDNAFSLVQSLSCVRLFVTLWTAARQTSLSITNTRSPPKPMFIESVMPFNHLILCRHLLLLPSILPSIRVFSNESVLHIRWPKYWSFSFNISPSNEHPGLISFRMDWLDLLAVQGTLESLLQHHSSKESILLSSAFFIVQLSHPYMTTGKTIALTRRTFVDNALGPAFIHAPQNSVL